MTEFNSAQLEIHIPDDVKQRWDVSKEYILDCVFHERMQEEWDPRVGDLMIGPTGNIWIISSKQNFCESFGGPMFFFGGNLCSRDGGCIMNETTCYTMNKDGFWYEWKDGNIVKEKTPSHCGFKDMRWIPRLCTEFSFPDDEPTGE